MPKVVALALLLAFATLFTLTGCNFQQFCGEDVASGIRTKVGTDEVLNSKDKVVGSETSNAKAGKFNNAALVNNTNSISREIVLTSEQETTAKIETAIASTKSAAGTTLELSSTVDTPAEKTGIIYSAANGVVTKVLVDLGDRVQAGQVVAQVNSPDISDAQAAYLEALAKVSQSRAQLETVKARLEISKTNERRVTQLNEEGVAAKKDMENARSARVAVQSEEAAATGAMNAAAAYLQAARVKLRALGLNEPSAPLVESGGGEIRSGTDARKVPHDVVTSELPIRSPVTGVVVKKDVFAGQSVGPSSVVSSSSPGKATSLMTIADLRKVWVMLEVPQREVPYVRLGSRIDFRSESVPDRIFNGRITRLAESFDPQSRTANVRAEIENPGELLKPGMLVIATLSRCQPTGGKVTVPPEAVQTLNGLAVVFTNPQPHHYRVQQVTCGAHSPDAVEITAGLRPGERHVISGAFYLKSECLRSSIAGGSSGE